MTTEATMEASVANALASAADWNAKGDVSWEASCVGTALEALLSIAVVHHDSPDAGISYLRSKGAGELIARYSGLNTHLFRDFQRGSRAAGVDNKSVLVHIAWLLGEHAVGDAILEIVCNAEVAKAFPRTRFWAEYDRALSSLVSRTRYVPESTAKLKGYEKFWAPYLELIAALTAGEGSEAALAACAASFTRRNRDKRLRDWGQHDGDGLLPVRWDFRVPSLLGRWHASR